MYNTKTAKVDISAIRPSEIHECFSFWVYAIIAMEAFFYTEFGLSYRVNTHEVYIYLEIYTLACKVMIWFLIWFSILCNPIFGALLVISYKYIYTRNVYFCRMKVQLAIRNIAFLYIMLAFCKNIHHFVA